MNPNNPTPCGYTSGDAGSGKTHKYRELIRLNPKWGLQTATTGIGAVTINGQTIHSLMSYSDLEDMRRVVRHGGFFGRLKKLFVEGDLWPGCVVVIDEHSMLNAEQLDTTLAAFDSLNNWIASGAGGDVMQFGGGQSWRACDRCDSFGEVERETGGPMACPKCGGNGDVQIDSCEEGLAPVGLTLVGDFAQLPPVEGKFAFHAESWGRFMENHEHLTTQYRQSDPAFLDALNLMRKGQGASAVEQLKKTAAQFSMFGDSDFDGVTIFGTNKDVSACNAWKYSQLTGKEFVSSPIRQGEQKKDWLKEDIVPKELKMKIGARVMILANEPGSFRYSNGDMGTLVDVAMRPGTEDVVAYVVELDRLKAQPAQVCNVCLGARVLPVFRPEEKDPKDPCPLCKGTGLLDFDRTVAVTRIVRESIDPNYHGPKWKAKELGKINGSVSYFPLKLGYALTVHKTQGLTLPKVQFNLSHTFTGAPAMCYVAISRVKTPEGLRIVGGPDMLEGRIQAHAEVLGWL